MFLIKDKDNINYLKENYKDCIFISASKQLKIQELITEIENIIKNNYITTKIFVPYTKNQFMSLIYDNLEIIDQINDQNGIEMKINGDKRLIEKIKGKLLS